MPKMVTCSAIFFEVAANVHFLFVVQLKSRFHLLIKKGEDPDPFFSVRVVAIKPELIELVGRGPDWDPGQILPFSVLPNFPRRPW